MEADTVRINFTRFVEDPSSGYTVASFYATYAAAKEPQMTSVGGGVDSPSSTVAPNAAPTNSTTTALPSGTKQPPAVVPSGPGLLQDGSKRIIYAPRVVEILRREVVIAKEFEIVDINTQCERIYGYMGKSEPIMRV